MRRHLNPTAPVFMLLLGACQALQPEMTQLEKCEQLVDSFCQNREITCYTCGTLQGETVCNTVDYTECVETVTAHGVCDGLEEKDLPWEYGSFNTCARDLSALSCEHPGAAYDVELPESCEAAVPGMEVQ